jgi:hypothetical protein
VDVRALSSADVSAIERSMSAAAMAPRDRYLPQTVDVGYVVGDGESLALALHRLTTEQFTIAIEALSDPAADVGIATDATLKSMARIAAVLRMVRVAIGDEAYRTELRILNETIDLLGALIEGKPELRALDQLRARYATVLRQDAFVGLRTDLLRRHQLKRLQALSQGEALEQTLVRLRRARARFAAWPLDTDTDVRMYGREPVDDDFASLARGLGKTYKRGRRHWQAVRGGDATAVGDLHREVRHLGHQFEVISSAWPDLLSASARACAQLDAVLAEEAGLAALAVVAMDPVVMADDTERSLLLAVVDNTRAELREIAAILGRRVYVEPGGLFIERMHAYWESRDLSLPTAHNR